MSVDSFLFMKYNIIMSYQLNRYAEKKQKQISTFQTKRKLSCSNARDQLGGIA